MAEMRDDQVAKALTLVQPALSVIWLLPIDDTIAALEKWEEKGIPETRNAIRIFCACKHLRDTVAEIRTEERRKRGMTP